MGADEHEIIPAKLGCSPESLVSLELQFFSTHFSELSQVHLPSTSPKWRVQLTLSVGLAIQADELDRFRFSAPL